MPKKDPSASLKEAIRMLEIQQAQEGKILKEQLFEVYENLKPINLIRGAFKELTSSLELKNNFFSNLISIITGYLTRRVIVGSSTNMFKKIAGNLLQYGITSIVSKYSETIKALGLQMINNLHSPRNDS